MDYDTYMGIQQFMSVSLQLYLDGNSLIIDTVLDYGMEVYQFIMQSVMLMKLKTICLISYL